MKGKHTSSAAVGAVLIAPVIPMHVGFYKLDSEKGMFLMNFRPPQYSRIGKIGSNKCSVYI